MTLDTVTQLLDRVRTSLWFVPGIMALAALGLALVTPAIDRAVSDEWLESLPLVYMGRPIGARAVLSTIATSMIGTAGVVFSMTIVSLQLASAQFGPRLLRTFLRDRGNQTVLGAFVGIFLYCIIVLPAIDTSGDAPFVPHIAVTLAILLAIVGLGLLVYFIDHVAQSIHADAVIQSVAAELEQVIDDLFPETIGETDEPVTETDPPARIDETPRSLLATGAGYVRFVNGDAIVDVAVENDLCVRIEVDPGQYVDRGQVIASTWPAEAVDAAIEEHVAKAIVLGAHRTPLQDAPFAFEQLAEMAVRALSPGINDPTTALHCIDRIGSGLALLVSRRLPARLRRDDEGVVRLIADPVSLEQVLEGSIDPIARNAGIQLPVWLRLLAVLRHTRDEARRSGDRAVLTGRASTFVVWANSAVSHAHDLERIRAAGAWAAADGGHGDDRVEQPDRP